MNQSAWPALSSAQSSLLSSDWLIFTFAGLGVAILVSGLIVFTLLRFRRRPGNEHPTSQNAKNPALEIAWTAVPLLFVIGLFVATRHIETDVERLTPDPAVRIAVNAFRWGWTFTYAGGPVVNGTSRNPPLMELPLGRPVALTVTSSDVIHSFWVPDMLFKRDAVPGRASTFDLTPSKLGTFVGRCAEFCGLDHALMTFRVRVVPPDAYARWLRENHR